MVTSPDLALRTVLPFVDPTGGPRVYQTSVADAQGEFVLHLAQTSGTAQAPECLVMATSATPQASSVPVAGGMADEQEVSSTTIDTLPLAAVERVFASTQLTSQAFQAIAFIEPAPILAWELHDEARYNGVDDLALLHTSSGLGQAADCFPNDALHQLGRRGSANASAIVVDGLDPSLEGDLTTWDALLGHGDPKNGRT
jgi:hypothetical protein